MLTVRCHSGAVVSLVIPDLAEFGRQNPVITTRENADDVVCAARI
jgi:hypothetical protein